jgi:hypothetical protein
MGGGMRRSLALLLSFALSGSMMGASGCKSTGCPGPSATPDTQRKWEAALDGRKELVLDPHREITIKRDVHSVVVATDAPQLAQAFHEVMRDGNRRFGLIRIDRKEAHVGKPFSVGERFQGRYQIDEAIRQNLEPWEKKIFGDFAKDPGVRTLLCDIENQGTSDYGIIAELNLTPKEGEDFVLSYHYLEGSPIAGSSTFVITQVSPGVSKVTQVFEYQELTASFALFFSSGGLKLHNGVVYNQAAQAAALLGVKVVSSDIPEPYRGP